MRRYGRIEDKGQSEHQRTRYREQEIHPRSGHSHERHVPPWLVELLRVDRDWRGPAEKHAHRLQHTHEWDHDRPDWIDVGQGI